MAVARSALWRTCFVLAGVLILAGGPLHPGGTIAQMLAHPDWVLAHVLMLAGFIALWAGLVLYRRGRALPPRTARWSRLAVYGSALQAVEMVFHTASVVDHHNLTAGQATPVLTTHLWLAAIAYPLFGLTAIGFIVATARERTLASPWIAWLGVIGAAAHGAAAPLVVLLEYMPARILFPMVMLFALWCVLAGLWLRRAVPLASPVAATAAD
jgi:hypothetical protein